MKNIFILLALAGCVSAEQIRGELWQIDQLPESFCTAHPDVSDYGIYRVVSCKGNKLIPPCANGELNYEEFISFCSKRMGEFLSAEKINVEDWLKKATRPRGK